MFVRVLLTFLNTGMHRQAHGSIADIQSNNIIFDSLTECSQLDEIRRIKVGRLVRRGQGFSFEF